MELEGLFPTFWKTHSGFFSGMSVIGAQVGPLLQLILLPLETDALDQLTNCGRICTE